MPFEAGIQENFCVNIYKQSLCLFEITDNLSKHIATSQNRLNRYAILWVENGEGNGTIDFYEFPLARNSIFFISPFQPFSFSNADTFSGKIILFDSEFFCLEKHAAEVGCNGILFNNIYDVPYITIDAEAEKYFSNQLMQMIEETKSTDIGKIDMLVTFLKQFLIKSTRIKKEQTIAIEPNNSWMPENEIIHKLKSLIEKNYMQVKSVQDYADMLNMSSRNLARIVSKYCKRTVTDLIHERVVIEAKRYLHYSNLPVKELAYKLGFDDPAHFSRYFKKYAEVSPDEYRKAIRNSSN
ncbi:MAG: AraC family transcriptional regulator [Chitinophagales bacterium]|nr:AraC family transcriptional regulator [Chitinophagales bacterium]